MDNDIPYRTPFLRFTPAASVSSTDENEFSTLLKVRSDFAEALANLSDFNAFEIYQDKLPADRAKMLLHDVEIKQGIYNALMPLFDTLDSTINDINAKYREKLNNGR